MISKKIAQIKFKTVTEMTKVTGLPKNDWKESASRKEKKKQE